MLLRNIILTFSAFTLSSLFGQLEPEAYHESNSGQFKHAIKELYKLNLTGYEHMLDIGSGDGKVSRYIAEKYLPHGTLTGIDKNNDMVIFANSRSAGSNVSYVCADILAYEPSFTYDTIVSFWTLHWVPDYQKALIQIAQLLKPGGKALCCHSIQQDPLQPIVDKLLTKDTWRQFGSKHILFPAPSLAQAVAAIEKSGLTVEMLEVKKNGEWMPVETVKKNFLSLDLFKFIPKNLQEAFCDEVLQAFITQYPLNGEQHMLYWLPVVVMVLEKK